MTVIQQPKTTQASGMIPAPFLAYTSRDRSCCSRIKLTTYDDVKTKIPGVTPSYKLYRYVPPLRVGFLRRFGLKPGIHFAHFGLESGMVFEETTGLYDWERIHRFNSK